jgi:hypothetical protein
MELLAKVAVVVVVLIAIAGVGFIVYNFIANPATPLTADQAAQVVVRDLKLHNPSANISVINVTPSTLKSNSWIIILSVIYNATRPCPTLFIEGFDYPATGLIPSVDNLYTENCTIYGLSTAP